MILNTELQKVSEETMIFMRGHYVLDEVGNQKDELTFRQEGKNILTIHILENSYEFMMIYGKSECSLFEARRNDFPHSIQKIYDKAQNTNTEKYLTIPVTDLHMLEAVKKIILIKKKPDRQPFPKQGAIYSSCGHRCDLCVHYNGSTISESFRTELKQRLIRVYADGIGDGGYWGENMQLCDGCHTGGLDKSFSCDALKCATQNGVNSCQNCPKKNCVKSKHLYQGLKPQIHTKTILADDVTWTILPYVYYQYENL